MPKMNWTSINIMNQTYSEIRDSAHWLGVPMGKLADELIKFALQHDEKFNARLRQAYEEMNARGRRKTGAAITPTADDEPVI